VRLASVAALQHLPPRQRAVVILREVLRWKADEVADLLDTTVASVNSVLQRARATGAAAGGARAPRPLDDDQRDLLARYGDAFERYDIDAFVRLLHDDATQHMPPFEMRLRGRDDIAAWILGPGRGCRGSRVIATEANGSPAVAQWRPAPEGGFVPWVLHMLETEGGRGTYISSFLNLDVELFRALGQLPQSPE
jgi:RNA polymerase sigma-70 factor (ECF subfamily)